MGGVVLVDATAPVKSGIRLAKKWLDIMILTYFCRR